jgi:hypothetical protein
VTADALRLNEAVGTAVPETVTVAVASLPVPAMPVQLIEYDWFCVSAPVL